MKFKQIPMNQISTSKNVRLEGEQDGELGDLIESIGKVDVLQPILVIERGKDRYEVVNGHRRIAAMRQLDFPFVPCIIRDDLSEDDLVYVKLAENVHRKQLTAREVIACADDMKTKNKLLTDSAIAKKLGKSPEWISYKRRVVRTIEKLQAEGVTIDVIRDLSDGELHNLAKSAGTLDKDRSEACTEAFKARAGRGPNGRWELLHVGTLAIYTSGKRLTVLCPDESLRERFLAYVKAFKAPKKTARGSGT
jgi:ParB/RepB/Spo0J family partition protein